jgi:serine/threonine protein kinase
VPGSTGPGATPGPCFTDLYAIEVPDAPLGVGQFGVVYAARPYADLSRRVAVKRIPLPHHDPEQMHRVLREVEILAAVGEHPHVVRLLEHRKEIPYLFLVMDLYEGGDLLHYLNASPYKHDRGLPPTHPRNLYLAQCREGEAARIIGQLASALMFLHAHGVTHRDVKPENILLETSERDSPVRLVDFGLSRMLPPGEETMRTKCGTDAYAAPEVLSADGGRARGYHRDVDIWSLGILLFVLLSHYHPFDVHGRSTLDYGAMREGRFATDTPEWAGVSLEAHALVRRLVVVDPSARMTLADLVASPWMARHRAAATLPIL